MNGIQIEPVEDAKFLGTFMNLKLIFKKKYIEFARK